MAPIPPVAPYGEYAEAFLFTAVVREDGRSGMAGAEENAAVGDAVAAVVLTDGNIPVEAPRAGGIHLLAL